MRTRAQQETEKVQALRELLGQEKLERYQAFATRVNDYRQVAKFNARLDAAHKLSPEQRDRLVELYHEQARSEADRIQFSMRLHALFPREPLHRPSLAEGLQRPSMSSTLTANEEHWRRMSKADEQFRQRAADVLTPPQLGVLAQMQAEKTGQLQRWIENTREQLGLSRDIPEQPEVPAPQLPPTREGAIKLAVKLTINGGGATHFTHTARNGEPVTFRCAERLFVEVRSTVYVDDAFDVRLSFYEESRGGRRRLIGESGQMGMITGTLRDGASSGSGNFNSVITGDQGYAIKLSTQIEPV